MIQKTENVYKDNVKVGTGFIQMLQVTWLFHLQFKTGTLVEVMTWITFQQVKREFAFNTEL